ncbi:type II toxin-antitoxin system death-on-curing family toxin [Micromonospora matsumotoense]|uniref:type II toxin-antitoxin system death-on-curing family toxin n=1 Tax=Micromonospora matsumotoense TaxID=121616 RepID=UPI003411B7D7
MYQHLVRDFEESGDPIKPAGIRSTDLLHSAIARQNTSLGGVLKYSNPIDCAAALTYGICNNHAFYNGNKRTALVSLLAHLDRNKLSLWGTNQDELYDFILAVASRTVAEWVSEKLGLDLDFFPGEDSSDVEVRMMSRWIGEYTASIKRGEKQVSYRELRKLLKPFGYELTNPQNNFIRVVYNDPGTGSQRNIDSIIYPGENRDVDINTIKRIRQRCKLREEDGVDSDIFYYRAGPPVDEFINHYRLVLRRLADT